MFKRKCKSIMNTFCMVTTCVVLAVALFTTVINPTDEIPTVTLWQIPVISALTSLGTLFYPWDRGMGKVEIVVRTGLHYVLVLLLVLWAGWWFQWYGMTIKNILCMTAVITVIFAVVSVSARARAAWDAKQMNERLQDYQQRQD